MPSHRGIDDGAGAHGADRLEHVGANELRRAARPGLLAEASLACPSCDAPVAPHGAPLAPADPFGCPVCGLEGAVREFLSLARPTRPARVDVVVHGAGPMPVRASRLG